MQIGKAKGVWNGFNIKTETIVDMKKEGIIDPHKVTKNALLNAASIAGTILLTECVVVDTPEDKKEGGFDPSMMAGMM
jgi:chaperonin GroEL